MQADVEMAVIALIALLMAGIMTADTIVVVIVVAAAVVVVVAVRAALPVAAVVVVADTRCYPLFI